MKRQKTPVFVLILAIALVGGLGFLNQRTYSGGDTHEDTHAQAAPTEDSVAQESTNMRMKLKGTTSREAQPNEGKPGGPVKAPKPEETPQPVQRVVTPDVTSSQWWDDDNGSSKADQQ